MILTFKKHSHLAVMPKRMSLGAAGFDLTAAAITEKNTLFTQYDTRISVAIPAGYVGLLVPRSSISATGWQLCNSVGVIDSDFRGSIKMRFSTHFDGLDAPYEVGDRIGQLVVVRTPFVDSLEVEELDLTLRDRGGFGSTGR